MFLIDTYETLSKVPFPDHYLFQGALQWNAYNWQQEASNILGQDGAHHRLGVMHVDNHLTQMIMSGKYLNKRKF